MPTDDPSLEGATAAGGADPQPMPEPDAPDKSSPAGAGDQENADPNPQPKPTEPSILEELGADEPKTDPPADPPPPDDQPPQDQDDRKPPERAQDDPGRKPEDQDDGTKPLAPEQERSTPKFARRRIKNLERELEAATASVRELEAIAAKAGFERGDEIVDAVEIYGRALKQRDPKALQEIERRLGITREAPAQAGIPPAVVKKLLAAYAYDELEKLAAEAEAKATQQPPPQQPPAKPPAEPEPQGRQPQADPEVQQAVGALRALAAEIRKQHGDDADGILADIKAEVDKADAAVRAKTKGRAGLDPSLWESEFSAARDAVLARRREQARRTPPKSLRSSSSADQRRSSTPLTDELLAT